MVDEYQTKRRRVLDVLRKELQHEERRYEAQAARDFAAMGFPYEPLQALTSEEIERQTQKLSEAFSGGQPFAERMVEEWKRQSNRYGI